MQQKQSLKPERMQLWSVSMCIHVFLIKSVKSNQFWCLDGMKICKHVALCVKEKTHDGPDGGGKSGCLLSNIPTSSGLPAGSPLSLLHQSSLLTKAREPTHSGVTHCRLYKHVGLATASRCSLRCSSILAGYQLLLRH